MDLPTLQEIAVTLGVPALTHGAGKLLATVADQIALTAEPMHKRRNAIADADVKLIEALSAERVRLVKTEIKNIIADREDRAVESALRHIDRRQRNLESIVKGSLTFVPETVSEEPVDQDWLTQFLVHSQDVGNEEMQSIWSQLLAGEVEKPGSYSLRTLALVKLLSREEAQLFTKLCKCVWTEDGGDSTSRHVLLPHSTTNGIKPHTGLSFADATRLEYVGLIRLVHQGCFHLTIDNPLVFKYGLHSFRVMRAPSYFTRQARPVLIGVDHSKVFEVGPIALTDIGEQLAPISGAEASGKYLEWVRAEYNRADWEISPI
jgi:hypothetical protein